MVIFLFFRSEAALSDNSTAPEWDTFTSVDGKNDRFCLFSTLLKVFGENITFFHLLHLEQQF